MSEARYVWRVTIRLDEVEPTVWRTILVRPDAKLRMLHWYIQAAMGWQDYHLFAFTIGKKEYGIPDPDDHRKVYDARRYTLARLFPEPSAAFEYVYDFGDWWKHTITLDGVEPAAFRKKYPICIAGENSCPPEDCGGPGGFDSLRAVLADPNDPEHTRMKEWARSQFYPSTFSPQKATWALRDIPYLYT